MSLRGTRQVRARKASVSETSFKVSHRSKKVDAATGVKTGTIVESEKWVHRGPFSTF